MKKLQKGSLAVAVVAAACWMNSKPASAGILDGQKCPNVGYPTKDEKRCSEQEFYEYKSRNVDVYTCTTQGAVATDTCDTRPRILAGTSTTVVPSQAGGKMICNPNGTWGATSDTQVTFGKDFRSTCSGGSIPNEGGEEPNPGSPDGSGEVPSPGIPDGFETA